MDAGWVEVANRLHGKNEKTLTTKRTRVNSVRLADWVHKVLPSNGWRQ